MASPSSAGIRTAPDVASESASMVTVSGQVSDGSGHGWPMYAKISVQGAPASTFTDPATGRYSLELPADASHTLVVESQYPGYAAASRTVDVGSSDVTQDVELTVGNCEAAPGYHRARVGTLGDNDGQLGDFLDSRGIRNNELGFFHEDPSLYDVIVLNDPGNRNTASFLEFLDGTDAAGTGVVFLDTRPSTFFEGTGIMLLQQHVGNPATRNLGFGEEIPYLYYKVTQPHPILDGFEVGDEIVFDDTSTSKLHAWFDGYAGEGRTVIADAARADTGVLGSGIGVQERANNRHVLLSMHGAEFFGSGPGNWTPDAAQVFVNALQWAAPDASFECRPVTGGLVVGNVTDANTGAGLANAIVADVDDPSGGVLRTTTVEGDPAHGQGFHWRFVPQTGSKTYRSSVPRYVDVTTTVDVRPDAANRVDFALPAGRLDISPGSLAAQLQIGQDPQQHTFTVTNTGTAPATVDLTERRGTFQTLGANQQPAEVHNVEGHFTPDAMPPGDRLGNPPTQPQAEPSASPWRDLTDYPQPIQDNSAAVVEDTVYSFGGFNGTASIADAYTFDPVTGRWDPIAPLPEDRMKPEVVEYDGLIYILGGWSGDLTTNRSVFVYDPASDSYRQAAPMPASRAAPGAAVVDGRIYVVGGCARFSSCAPSNTVWRYDPATDSWETLADYPETVSWLGCAGLQGRLYCAGGARAGDSDSASTYEYNPASNTWSRRANLPYDNWGMSYAAANGQLVISGGVTFGRRVTTNRGAAYDPATDRWTEIEPASQAVSRGGGACGFYKVGGKAFLPTSNVEVHPEFNGCPVTTDVPWLTVTPQTATLQPGEQLRAAVQLAPTVDQPGTYTAGVGIRHGTPYPVAPVAVTAVVDPPSSWGKVTGTVTGVDCSGNESALEGAVVRINHRAGGTTQVTDGDGGYGYWIAAGNNPLDLVVSADGHLPQARSAQIRASQTIVEDFTLQRVCGTG